MMEKLGKVLVDLDVRDFSDFVIMMVMVIVFLLAGGSLIYALATNFIVASIGFLVIGSLFTVGYVLDRLIKKARKTFLESRSSKET